MKHGTQVKILLSGVFGPYVQHDEYGSRPNNPMELHHNQVTRVQGPFSVRLFHPSFGLRFIAANLDAPVTVLDFPTIERFESELKKGYDIVGIGSIMTNILKVKKMCGLVRKILPKAKIVIGGPIFNLPDIEKRIDADHIVHGEGVTWFREYLGMEDKEYRHPVVKSGFGFRILGVTVPTQNNTATLIPTLGCPMGCNFCLTSAMFGGKGKSHQFFRTGDELFRVMCGLEQKLNTSSFFILDENFLLYKKRTLRLLELMKEHNKSWTLLPFTSAQILDSYTMDELVQLGIQWVWIGLEGMGSRYTKLKGIDTHELVKKYQANGITVLGSSIIGLEHHTPENIHDVIDFALSHNTDLHQFMLYTALPGTPLYKEMAAKGKILPEDECPPWDYHGQYMFNYRHDHLTDEEAILLHAFRKDFKVNGPSAVRVIRTHFNGWKRHKNHPDARVRKRIVKEEMNLKTVYPAALEGTLGYYKDNIHIKKMIQPLLDSMYAEFSPATKVFAKCLGAYLTRTIRKEAKRMQDGWTYEPWTLYNKNAAAMRLGKDGADLIDYV